MSTEGKEDIEAKTNTLSLPHLWVVVYTISKELNGSLKYEVEIKKDVKAINIVRSNLDNFIYKLMMELEEAWTYAVLRSMFTRSEMDKIIQDTESHPHVVEAFQATIKEIEKEKETVTAMQVKIAEELWCDNSKVNIIRMPGHDYSHLWINYDEKYVLAYNIENRWGCFVLRIKDNDSFLCIVQKEVGLSGIEPGKWLLGLTDEHIASLCGQLQNFKDNIVDRQIQTPQALNRDAIIDTMPWSTIQGDSQNWPYHIAPQDMSREEERERTTIQAKEEGGFYEIKYHVLDQNRECLPMTSIGNKTQWWEIQAS